MPYFLLSWIQIFFCFCVPQSAYCDSSVRCFCAFLFGVAMQQLLSFNNFDRNFIIPSWFTQLPGKTSLKTITQKSAPRIYRGKGKYSPWSTVAGKLHANADKIPQNEWLRKTSSSRAFGICTVFIISPCPGALKTTTEIYLELNVWLLKSQLFNVSIFAKTRAFSQCLYGCGFADLDKRSVAYVECGHESLLKMDTKMNLNHEFSQNCAKFDITVGIYLQVQ